MSSQVVNKRHTQWLLPERVLVGKLIGKVEKMVKYFPLGRIIGASVSEPHTGQNGIARDL